MSSSDSPVQESVYFCYANPAGFSGQKAATELIMKGLSQRGWICRPMSQPVLDRHSGDRLALPGYLGRMLTAWLLSLRLLVAGRSWLCVNLGQTRAAFLRDAVPLFLGRVGLGRDRIVISLHGSVFMLWEKASIDARLFCFLLKQAGMVTVLGERQRSHLVALGLSPDRVQVIVNSCDLKPVSAHQVVAKHRPREGGNIVVRCLYLSSLIDTKGFPEYLEALRRLSCAPGPRIEAVLCGKPVASEFSTRFRDVAATEMWIEQQIVEINRTSRVQVRWIKGAMGQQKISLFHEAEIFVLPTRYAVEAQPLVLLEAMASGCAIVTTRVGEIPTILDEQSADFLDEPSPQALADALQKLASDADVRGRLARAAHTRYINCFQIERHLDQWEKVLCVSGLPVKAAS